MEKRDLEQIITNYNYAYITASRLNKQCSLSKIYELFDKLHYHVYNFNEIYKMFDLEIGDLIMTYTEKNGIEECIQIWDNDTGEWIDATITEVKLMWMWGK